MLTIYEIMAIFISVCFTVFYVLGIVFFFGKCGFLITGYHFEPKGDKALRYHKYVMRRIAILFLLILVTLHACVLSGLLGNSIVVYVMMGVVLVIAIFGLIWFKTNKKFKRARFLEKELSINEDYSDAQSEFDIYK